MRRKGQFTINMNPSSFSISTLLIVILAILIEILALDVPEKMSWNFEGFATIELNLNQSRIISRFSVRLSITSCRVGLQFDKVLSSAKYP